MKESHSEWKSLDFDHSAILLPSRAMTTSSIYISRQSTICVADYISGHRLSKPVEVRESAFSFSNRTSSCFYFYMDYFLFFFPFNLLVCLALDSSSAKCAGPARK